MEDVPYGRILREGWLIIVLLALLGAGGSYGLAKLLPQSFVASSTLMLQVSSPTASLFERNQFALARIKTYPALVDSPTVVDGIRGDLGLDDAEYSDRNIRQMLEAQNTQDTVLLVVTAEAGTATLASDMANSAAAHMSDLIEQTENDGDAGPQYDVRLEQVLPANPPQSPASPQVAAITGLGGVLGLAVGGIIAVYRTTTRRRLSTIGDVRRASGLPVVGMVPRRAAAVPDAMIVTLGNLIALGGRKRRAFVFAVDEHDLTDSAQLTSFIDAGVSVGRDVVVLDLRGAVTGSTTALLADLRGEQAPHREIFATPQGMSAREIERDVPVLVSEVSHRHDLVIIVAPARSTSLLAELYAGGAAVVAVARHGKTPAGELAAFVSRMRVMGVRTLGVLLTHTGGGGLDAIARSWRASDIVELPSTPPRATEAERVRVIAVLADAEPEPARPQSGTDDLSAADASAGPGDSDVAPDADRLGSAPGEPRGDLAPVLDAAGSAPRTVDDSPSAPVPDTGAATRRSASSLAAEAAAAFASSAPKSTSAIAVPAGPRAPETAVPAPQTAVPEIAMSAEDRVDESKAFDDQNATVARADIDAAVIEARAAIARALRTDASAAAFDSDLDAVPAAPGAASGATDHTRPIPVQRPAEAEATVIESGEPEPETEPEAEPRIETEPEAEPEIETDPETEPDVAVSSPSAKSAGKPRSKAARKSGRGATQKVRASGDGA